VRTTLTGGLQLLLLLLLALLAVGVIRQTGGQGSLLSGWLPPPAPAARTAAAPAPRAPEPAPAELPAAPAQAQAPAAPPAEPPAVIAAGELSVLEADAPEPMVRYFDANGSLRMVRGLERVPAAQRASAVVLKSDKVNLVNVPAPSAVAFQDWQPAPNRNRHDVVLFSAPWCGVCERAKRYLDQRGVRYDERDIDADDSAREQVLRVLGQVAIPLLEVDGRYISGFRPDVYDRALQ
jgi:glutaredoxin